MRTSSNLNKSALPEELLLDDLWSKVRRDLVHQLEAWNLWISEEKRQKILNERRAQGESLLRKIVAPAIGSTDYAHLNSESVFGCSNFRFRSRLPTILAFGHDMGLGIHSGFVHGRTGPQNAATVCALFNLAISMFDRLCDNSKDAAVELHHSFDERTLHRIVHGQRSCKVLAEAAEDLRYPEARIFLKIICSAFFYLHDWAQAPPSSQAWTELNALLGEAYRAELVSARFQSSNDSVGTLIAAAERKSTIPFEAMLRIVRLCDGSVEPNQDTAVSNLAHRIGTAFRLMDDLIDIVNDIKSGRTNTILLRASGSRDLRRWPDCDEQLIRLLEGTEIEKSIDVLSANLAGIVQTFAVGEPLSGSAYHFQDLILTYVRGWSHSAFV